MTCFVTDTGDMAQDGVSVTPVRLVVTAQDRFTVPVKPPVGVTV